MEQVYFEQAKGGIDDERIYVGCNKELKLASDEAFSAFGIDLLETFVF